MGPEVRTRWGMQKSCAKTSKMSTFTGLSCSQPAKGRSRAATQEAASTDPAPSATRKRTLKTWTALADAQLLGSDNANERKWALVAAAFPGRSAAECQSRFDALVEARTAAAELQNRNSGGSGGASVGGAEAGRKRRSRKGSARQSPVKAPAPLPPPGNLVKELTLSPLALPPRSDTASPIYSKMSNFQAVHDFDLDAFLTQSSQGGEASTMQRLHHMQMQQIPTQTQLMLQYPQTPGYQNMVPESPSEGREGRYPFECPDSRCAKVINSRQSWAYHKLRCPTLPKAPPSRGRKAASSLRFDHSEMQHNVQISATGQVAIPRLGPPEPTPNGNNPPKRLSRMHKTYTGPVLPQTTVPMAPKSLATTNMDTFWSHDNVTALDPSLPSAGASSSAVAALSEEPFDFHSAEIGNTLLVPPPLLDGPGLSAIIGSSGPFTRQNSANTAASTAASTGAPMQRSHAYPTRNSRFSSSTASSPLHTMAIANSTMIAMASGGRRKLNSVTEVQEISTEDFALSQTETGISRGELEQLFEDYSSQASPDEYSSLIPDQVEPEWMWSAEKVFSKQQLSLLKMQMCNNFQLVAQTYVMEKEMHGADAYETQHWEDQLRALESLRDFGIKNLGPTSFCNVLPVSRFDLVAALQSNARNQPRSEAARTFIKCMSYQHTESECKERMAKQLEVSLGQKTRSGKARSAEARWSSAAFSVAPLFEGLVKLQEVCRTGWSVELVPNILRMRKKKVPDFLPHEDALLLRGLICFGVADLDSIRALCLPAKTIAGISGRIKALTARGKQDNALKSLLLRPFKPLTILEKDLMRVGIATDGHAYLPKLLKFFGHHPLPILKAEWERMYTLQEVSTTFPAIMDTEALVSSVDCLSKIQDGDDADEDDDDMDESDSDEDVDDDGSSGSDSQDIFAFINEEAFADEDDTDDDFKLDDSAVVDTAASEGSADVNTESVALREQKLSAAGMEVMLALQPHQKDKHVKRKSYTPKLVPQNQDFITEAGNENYWSFSASRKESLDCSGARLRKMSLAVHTGNSTVGRGRIRGKKKTAVMNPGLTDKASPIMDPLFKKPLPTSYAPFNLSTSPTKHINSASSSFSHSLPLPGTTQSNFLSSEADFDSYDLWVDYDNCANADDRQAGQTSNSSDEDFEFNLDGDMSNPQPNELDSFDFMAFINAETTHEAPHCTSDALYGLMSDGLNPHLPISVSSPTMAAATILADRNSVSAPEVLKGATSTAKEAAKGVDFESSPDENFSGHASPTKLHPAMRRPKRRQNHLSEIIAPLENKRARLMDSAARKQPLETDGRRVRRRDFAVAAALAGRTRSMFGPI